MKREGPPLEVLLRRLSEAPPSMVAGASVAQPLLADLLRDVTGELVVAMQFNPHRLTAVAVWLLRDDAMATHLRTADHVVRTNDGLRALARLLSPTAATEEPDGREEVARRVLALLELRPAGETAKQAADRLTALDTVERDRVTRETAQAEARAREVRERMAREAAEAAAQRYSPE